MFPQYDEFGRLVKVGPAAIPPQAQPSPTYTGRLQMIPPQAEVPDAPMPTSGTNLPQPVQLPAALTGQFPQEEVRQIQPLTALPAQQRLESIQAPPSINDPQYKNSRLRTVLNAIAGGFAGASGGPKVGAEIGSMLHDWKYNRAMQDYQGKLDLLKAQTGSEQHRQQYGNTAFSNETRLTDTESKINKRIDDVVRDTARTGAIVKKADTDAVHKSVLDKRAQWQMENPGANSRLGYMMSLDPEELKEAQQIEKTEAEDKATAGIGASDTKLQHSIDIKAQPENLIKQGATAAATGFAGAKARETGTGAGRLAVEELPQNKQRIEQLATEMAGNPDQYFNQIDKVDPKLKAAVTEAFLNKNKDLPNKLPPTQHTAVANSQVALAHARNIQSLFDDPDIANNWGPIRGRMNKVMSKWGGKSFNDDTSRQAAFDSILSDGTKLGITGKEQELLGYLAYLVTYEASSASGTRPSWQLINFLKSEASPQPSMERDRFQGALNTVKGTAVARVTEAFKKTKGGLPVADDKNKEDDFWNSLQVRPVVNPPGGKK